MRFISCAGLVALLFAVCIMPFKAHASDSKYVQISSSFANVYEYLDPKSTVIKQAKKGDQFELVYEGTQWYQIKVRDKVGWLEKRSGDVIDAPSGLSSVSVMGIIFFFILLAGTLGGVTYYIYKQKTAEVEA